MSSLPEQLNTEVGPASLVSTWVRRFLVVLTVLAALIIVGIVFWFFGLIAHPIILLFLGTTLAYLLYPFAQFLHRHLPSWMAILLAYVIVFAVIGIVLFYVGLTVLTQLTAMTQNINKFFQNYQAGKYPQLSSTLASIGITPSVMQASQQQLVKNIEGVISQFLPLVGSIFIFFIDVTVVLMISAYLIVDGPRLVAWLEHRTPLKRQAQINFLLVTVDQKAGGYIRGQVFMATLMSILVTTGAVVIGVPYAALIGVIVFFFEFIPQIGAYISGTIGFLFALTGGWQTALIYGIYVSLLQGIVDGQILAPRILGHSVGIHPVVSVFFMFVFGTLFGLWGAFLAAPIVGIIQVYVVASWSAWQQRSPEQFPEVEEQKEQKELKDISSAGQGVVET
ncbi:MAG TPA: AI-2E family transporter [Ktedonobacteraceae bacterium]